LDSGAAGIWLAIALAAAAIVLLAVWRRTTSLLVSDTYRLSSDQAEKPMR
jgi:K+ transporter